MRSLENNYDKNKTRKKHLTSADIEAVWAHRHITANVPTPEYCENLPHASYR